MIFTTPLPFIKEFIDQLDQGIRECAPTRQLSKAQRWWLSFCLMGILLSNSVCWAAFERVGLGGYQQAALSCAQCQLLFNISDNYTLTSAEWPPDSVTVSGAR